MAHEHQARQARSNALETYLTETGAPDWFDWAITQPFTQHQVDVQGCAINYLYWPENNGAADAPGILFLHGGGAHARWWQFIAPFFTKTHRVAAMDLSGMGDSEHRAAYSIDLHAREAEAILDDTGFGSNSFVVGHSLGGFITMRFASQSGARVRGVVIVDSPVPSPGSVELPQPPPIPKTHRVHPTRGSALARFRVVPQQPCDNDFVLSFIAQHSVKQVAEGWQWKFDPVVFGPPRFGGPFREYLGALQCPGALIYGEQSALVSADTATYMGAQMGANTPVVSVPHAYHHVLLDQPLGFVCALRALLAGWK